MSTGVPTTGRTHRYRAKNSALVNMLGIERRIIVSTPRADAKRKHVIQMYRRIFMVDVRNA
jgi:hypothetical protein